MFGHFSTLWNKGLTNSDRLPDFSIHSQSCDWLAEMLGWKLAFKCAYWNQKFKIQNLKCKISIPRKERYLSLFDFSKNYTCA